MTNDGGWRIAPDDVANPTEYRHVCLRVPDTRTHRLAFGDALYSLTRWWNYEREGEKRGTDFAKSWMPHVFDAMSQLHENLDSCCDTDMPDCIAYPMSSPAVEYFPESPYIDQSEPLPTGYGYRSWQVGGVTLPPIIEEIVDFLGVEQSVLEIPDMAVMTFLINILPDFRTIGGGILNSGYPRMKIKCQGTGTIRIHFVSVPLLGGMASVALDREINPLDVLAGEYIDFVDFTDTIGRDVEIVDLNRDFSIPPETDVKQVQEYHFDEPGEHFVEITFLPVVDDSATFLRFGGGVHYFEFCEGLKPQDNGGVIVTNADELTNSVTAGLKNFYCGCGCGDGTSGGDGGTTSPDGYTDEDNDGVDDATGEVIPTVLELQRGAAEGIRQGYDNALQDIISFYNANYGGA